MDLQSRPSPASVAGLVFRSCLGPGLGSNVSVVRSPRHPSQRISYPGGGTDSVRLRANGGVPSGTRISPDAHHAHVWREAHSVSLEAPAPCNTRAPAPSPGRGEGVGATATRPPADPPACRPFPLGFPTPRSPMGVSFRRRRFREGPWRSLSPQTGAALVRSHTPSFPFWAQSRPEQRQAVSVLAIFPVYRGGGARSGGGFLFSRPLWRGDRILTRAKVAMAAPLASALGGGRGRRFIANMRGGKKEPAFAPAVEDHGRIKRRQREEGRSAGRFNRKRVRRQGG